MGNVKKSRNRTKIAVKKHQSHVREKGKELEIAVQYCHDHSCGARRAMADLLKCGKCQRLTVNILHRALHPGVKKSRQNQNSILTNVLEKECRELSTQDTTRNYRDCYADATTETKH